MKRSFTTAVTGAVLRGRPTGDFPGEAVLGTTVTARVDPRHRRDTERNHTATHLLHAALRSVLGDHVRQRGSLVAADRLRFDFAHTAPMTDTELDEVSAMVVEGVWASHPVRTSVRPHAEAVEAGAMALFGEKYGDEVRVVEIPNVSMELCGGTHVRHTGEIGPFVITSESGVAAGVRRIEALTGRGAFDHLAGYKHRIGELAGTVKAQPANVERRVNELLAEKAALEALVDDLQRQDGGGAEILAEAECDVNGSRLTYRGVRIRARGARDARNWGDRFREAGGMGVAVVAAEMPGDKHVLFAFATDAAIAAGVRADAVVREVAAAVGGRGGGRPHMAQAGVADPEGIVDAVRRGARGRRQPGGKVTARENNPSGAAALTLGEWIDRRERPVPEPLRRHLDADGPVTADAMVSAAERAAQACTAGSRRNRDAAFGLLAADAHITFACLWLVLNDGGIDTLRMITNRVASAAWRE